MSRRDLMPRALKIADRCVEIVRGESDRRDAICLVVGPSAASSATADGWGVSRPAPASRDAPAARSSVVAIAVQGAAPSDAKVGVIQSIWTASQEQLPVVFVVMSNSEYAILESFAVVEETPGVPGLDVPGLDMVALAQG